MPGKRSGPGKTDAKGTADKGAGDGGKAVGGGKRKTRPMAAGEESSPGRDSHFPVVGIGASAGGLEALDELMAKLPVDTGMAFVVVTHQHPGHTSLLPELLGKETKMPVLPTEDGLALEPNHVYVGTPGAYLAILGGKLHRMETEAPEAPRLPIDYFFRSLAEDQGEHAICIVLSGTGTDGTLGLKAVKGESGMAMVQQPESAKYAGMPSSAVATGLADFVLEPSRMPEQLAAYAKGTYLKGAALAAETPVVPIEPMQKILVLLRSRTGHDFSNYKTNTMRRRIERRMNVHQISKPDRYLRLLQENPHELDFLFKELLISVTNFFRDPEAWEALAEKGLDTLLRSRPDGATIRAWVPGCATGEEVYSLAIVLREAMERTDQRFDVQIFGSDLDADAIETARSGQFPEGIAADVKPEWLERYFTRQDGFYRIRNEIREMAIFAPQNVIKDPPFTKLDILSCRNLMIYLNGDLQKKLLPIFHYALKPGGLLFLGPSETISTFTDLYDTIEKHWKIFRRKESSSGIRALPEFPAQPVAEDDEVVPARPEPPVKAPQVSTVIERLLLGRFAPASVVVTDRGEIVFIHGRTGAYLEPSAGQPRNNIIEMAREGLQMDLAAALRQAAATEQEVRRERVRVKTNGDSVDVDLSVSKIHDPEAVRGLFLVTFRPVAPEPPVPEGKEKGESAGSAESEPVKRLERELQYAKESLQTTVEELETSNEELKSTNEELQSTNEELQSTNEELETSKEEMQSLNEELTTVNAELQSKVDELSQSNNDMQNLLNSTDIATIFLDNDLNIQRFTERASHLVNLIPSDVGRPIGDLAANLQVNDLAGTCAEVLHSLVFKEAEVEGTDGSHYLMRVMPYRTAENVIDGLVVTFVNINRLKELERRRVEAIHSFFEDIVNTVREPMVVLDSELRVVQANHAFYQTFRTHSRDTIGMLIFDLGSGQWDIPDLHKLLLQVLPKNRILENYEVEARFPDLGERKFTLNARRLEQREGLPGMILLAFGGGSGPS